MGHCFNPCVTHYWHFILFTLDHWNGLACYTAALRYINMNAEKYSINTDHIGVMGISKGQYAVTRLSDPNNAGAHQYRGDTLLKLNQPEEAVRELEKARQLIPRHTT
jgi:tetratricopeptide (TPR) repeat protein